MIFVEKAVFIRPESVNQVLTEIKTHEDHKPYDNNVHIVNSELHSFRMLDIVIFFFFLGIKRLLNFCA